MLTRYGKSRGQKRSRSGSRVSRPVPRRSAYTPYNAATRGTNPSNHVVFKGKGFPDRLTTNLVYSDSIVLDPSAATPIPTFAYRLTSCFDPQFTLGGGQPTYWDQLSAVYSRYTVNGAKITCIFSRSSTTAANIGPYIVGISMQDTNGVATSSQSALMSSPNTNFQIVSQDGGNRTVVGTYSKKNTYPDFADGLQARTNANPSIDWFANVWASPTGIDVEAPINVVVIIEYNVTLSDVIDVIDV